MKKLKKKLRIGLKTILVMSMSSKTAFLRKFKVFDKEESSHLTDNEVYRFLSLKEDLKRKLMEEEIKK